MSRKFVAKRSGDFGGVGWLGGVGWCWCVAAGWVGALGRGSCGDSAGLLRNVERAGGVEKAGGVRTGMTGHENECEENKRKQLQELA